MEHATALVDRDATTHSCSCQKMVAAGWKVSCHSCGRNDLGVTLRPVGELEAGDRVLVYGDVEAVVEGTDDATKAGDVAPWATLHYALDNGLRGHLVTRASTPLPVLVHVDDVPTEADEHSPSCSCGDCDLERRRAAALVADAVYADRVPARAAALYRFIAACEDVVEAQPERDCRACVGAGCRRCGGLGFALDPALTRAVQTVLAAGAGLCDDDGHALGCTCGGELVPVAAA